MDGLSVKDAAAHLNVSIKTVRNWIKDGKVAARKVQTSRGHEWRVFPDEPPPMVSVVPDAGQTVPSGINEQLALVDDLRRDLEQRTGQLGFALGQLALLSAEVTRLREENERLKAPREIILTPEPEPEPEPRRSWWQKLFGI